MKASQTQLFKILDGRKQYIIPIYQRTYSWTEKQCEQLWEDIVHVSENEDIAGHFLGSIVYIEKGIYQASDISQLHVIDGQQRLTTLSLLLTAFGEAVGEAGGVGDITKAKIQNLFLFNRDETDDKRYKLLLTQSDKDTLTSIIEEKPLPEKSSPNIVNNFKFFQNQIKRGEISLEQLYKGILKLIIVDISLDKNYDNPQQIFESLNSTGLALSQADLIRNFVLMGLEREKQNNIYHSFWYPIEQSFRHSQGPEYFDRFMRDYLTIKTDEIPRERDVYTNFKEYFLSELKDVLDLVKDIYYYSQFFTALAFEKTDDAVVKQKIHDINSLPVDVAFPFLLQVMADHKQGLISRDTLLEILDLVESYVFRRQICEIPTNSLNKTFATLYNLIDKENYLESLKAKLVLKETYRRIPNDSEFREQFQVKNVYNFRTRNYLFRKLENHGRKEPVKTEEFTLEHIMPQNENVPQAWRDELGENWMEIHNKCLHRVGNLTLTGYNSELSDKAFAEKQKMEGGFKDSPIRLNAGLATLEHWNENEIHKRSKILADKALEIWKYPNVTEEVLEKYREEEDEDDDEFETHAVTWDDKFSKASPEIQEIINKAIEAVKQKFDCIDKSWSRWYAFYIQTPTKRKNCFLVFRCSKTTADACFRVDNSTFNFEDKNIRTIKGYFFKHTERRIFMTKDNLEQVLKYIEHAYLTTQNYSKKEKERQSAAAHKAWDTAKKTEQ